MTIATLSGVVWTLLQVALLYYTIWAMVQNRHARRLLAEHQDAARVGAEKFRAHAYRLSAIFLYLLLGIASFFPRLPGYTPFFVFALLYGEWVLFRNMRGDVRLIRTLASELEERERAASLPLDADRGGTPVLGELEGGGAAEQGGPGVEG